MRTEQGPGRRVVSETRPVAADVTVVVPTYNRRELLARTLDSLERLDPRPAEVIVVSDGSTDGTGDLVRGRRLSLLESHSTGAGGARNVGWRAARTAIVAFVDDDCTVEPRWADALAEYFADTEAGLVQGRTRPAGEAGPNDRTLDIRWGNGLFESCNIAYRREVLEAVGGFDESFGREFSRKPSPRSKNRLPLGEDTDLGWRVRRAGWRAAFAEDAVVRHAVFPGRFADSVREEWRKRQFPYVVRHIPELRDAFPRGRWFLRRQSPSAQLALVGGLLTIFGRRAPVRLFGAVLTAPYVRWVLRREPTLGLAARQAVRDAVGSAALVAGSVQQRTLLL